MSTSISATEIGLPDNAKLKLGTGEDLEIFHDGSNSYLTNGTGVFNLQGSGSNIQLQAVNGESGLIVKPDNAVELYFNGSKKFETFADGIKVVDDGSVVEIELITNSSSVRGKVTADSGNQVILATATDENMLIAKADGAVELYHNNSKKFETASDGVLIGDGALFKFGADSDAYISHTGSDFIILNSTGTLAIGNNSGTGVGEGSIVFKSGNNNARWTIESGGNFIPAANNAFAIGSSSNRVSIIYSNAALNTSDKTLKNTITTSDLGLDFINKLKPVSYKWNQYEGEISDTRTHYGLIAQDVEEVITSSGKTLNDFGGVDKPEEGCMGLAYSQFVSPLIKAVQELSAKVASLEAA